MSKNNLHIAFMVPGMPFNGDTPHKASLGGSETAGWALARELAARGHTVRMFANLPDNRAGTWDDVQYFPIQASQSFFDNIPHDVSIIQRMPEFFSHRIASKLHILWCHDLGMARMFGQFRASSWNIDACAVVSDWMKEQYKRVYEMKDEYFFLGRNGITLDDFPPSFRKVPYEKAKRRDRKRLVFSARPERGMDVLVKRILPPLFAADPEIHVSLFGYYNPVEHFQQFYNEMSQECAKYGNRIMFEGYKDKRSLYTDYTHSGIYVYPTPSPILPSFAEVSCISLMEAQAAGMPIVSSNRGALSETLAPGAGALIDGDPMSDEYRDAFVAKVLHYVNDETAYMEASIAGRKAAEKMLWSQRAEEWEGNIERLMSARNSDPVRRAYHFYRNSDIGAARQALAAEPGGAAPPSAKRLVERIEKNYSFADTQETLAAHYRSHGEETTKRLRAQPLVLWSAYAHQTDEVRFKVIEEYLEKNPQLENILDYGCGHGWGAVYWHNKLGRTWTGLDVDPGAVEWSKDYAGMAVKDASKLTFLNLPADDDPWWAEHEHTFDMALISEVLEHLPDPIKVVERVERLVKPGMPVYITVPYGPSEYGTPNWTDFRNHLWHFEYSDLAQIFGGKVSNIQATLDRYNEVTGDATGFYTAVYKADHKPLKPIDMERKQQLQCPQQTLSINIVGGPGCELTLRWCLESIKWVADEIIIADTGMNDEAKEIAAEYEAVLVPAPDPREAGFDEPRNAALAASSMDWVLWIDTDERLFGGNCLPKYLRDNQWQGMAIRQHHFAVDTTFSPDVPVRLFRRRPFEDKSIRFFGAIHEHPELSLNEGPGPVMIITDVNIAHIGYLDEPVRRRKFDRNYPLLQIDQKKYPERRLQKYFIMRDNCMLNSYEVSLNGGVVTEAMKDRARQIIELYTKYFSAKEGESYLNINPHEYYTLALRILNEGIDVQFHITASRDGVGDAPIPNVPVYRFKDAEEAALEVARIMRNKAQDLSKPEW